MSSGATSPLSNWSRVSQLVPGSEIAVTSTALRAAPRYFVSADELALTMLDLTDPALPAAAARVLRDMALRHPEYFAAMQRNDTFGERSVRVGRAGVFVADRKVAELENVVETIARRDVVEIWGPVVARGSVLGPMVGGWLGFAVGVVPLLGGASSGVGWPLLAGSVGTGGYLGFIRSDHRTNGLVFRAP